MMKKSLAPVLTRLIQMPQVPSWVPTQVNLLLVQTLACHPTSLGVDYQRDMAQCGHSKVFHEVCPFINFSFTTPSVDLMSLQCCKDCKTFFNKYFTGHILFAIFIPVLGCLGPQFVGDNNNVFTKY